MSSEQRGAQRDPGAAPLRGVELERGADLAGALAHAGQAQRIAVLILRHEAATVMAPTAVTGTWTGPGSMRTAACWLPRLVAAARASGSGRIDYKWVHLVSQQAMVKTAYFKKSEDLVLACGIFKTGAAPAG